MSSDSLKLLSYDFDFITRSLGLIPIDNGHQYGINPGAITHIKKGDYKNWIITLHSGEEIHLIDEQMVQLEATIRRREEEAKAILKDRVKDQTIAQHEVNRIPEVRELARENVRDQIVTQQSVIDELNNRVAAPAPMIIGMPGKKGRN